MQFSNTKVLTTFSLVMINVIAVDNLRSLPIAASFGSSLLFFYLAAAILFFIPSILVTAELATAWPVTGGVYIWIKEAFGPRIGFYSIWLQWIYNVVWYPTIFSVIAGICAYLIDPNLLLNPIYMLSSVLTAYWIMTVFNCLGLKASSLVSALGAIIGTILPMLLIAILGLFWVHKDKPTLIHFSFNEIIPNLGNTHNLAFLSTLIFGLMGMEMSGVHANEVKNPQRDYPKALFYSGMIILSTLVLSSLAIALVIPSDKLNLVSGLIDAYDIFFNIHGIAWMVPIIILFIVIGSLCGAAAWIIGSARGLLVASTDSQLPKIFLKVNKFKMPVGILMLQGLIVTVLSSLFIILPSVNNAYWILSNLTSQLALIFYVLFFAAAIRLRYKHKNHPRSFQIPGGMLGIWLVCGTGIITCLGIFVIGFIPPDQVSSDNIIGYEIMLVTGILICCIPAAFIKESVHETVSAR